MKITNLLLLLPLFFAIPIQSSPKPSSEPPHFLRSTKNPFSNLKNETSPQEYFEVTRPIPANDITPACSVNVLSHSFGNTYGSPPVDVTYTPPPETCEWSLAVLEFRAECKGDQYDRIAGVWIDGVELLRTSTAQPTEDGIFWSVRKDVSRYSSVITKPNSTLAVMLENIVNDEFTGVYHVNISFHFYDNNVARVPLSIVPGESGGQKLNRKLISVNTPEIDDELEVDRALNSLYPYYTPADLVLPISGVLDEGFWFRIQDEFQVQETNVKISQRTKKAVLELYVSFHGDDEFWYMNPADAYVETNHLDTGRAHGTYREVLVTIDGKLVGSVIPFPVIFTGGINPLFWEPVVSIGAFDLPSYDIDLTPFLGLLLDNQTHSIGLQVADGISFWLIDANLHIWLDESEVKAETLKHKVPLMEIERKSEFEHLDGEFEVQGERQSQITGWVNSTSSGYLKTQTTEKIKFKNRLKFKSNGTRKEIEQKIKKKMKIKVTNEMGDVIRNLEVKITYPLKISINTQSGLANGTSLMNTTVEQGRKERFYDGNEDSSRSLTHKQNCTGSMVIKGNSVLSGSAENHQKYNYQDELGCYSRKVDVVDGDVVGDQTFLTCEV